VREIVVSFSTTLGIAVEAGRHPRDGGFLFLPCGDRRGSPTR
jgi:hypothetical protein